MFEQASANAIARPIQIRCKLAQEQAGDRIRRLADPYIPRESRRYVPRHEQNRAGAATHCGSPVYDGDVVFGQPHRKQMLLALNGSGHE
jgi:hypothetical protein